MPWKIFLFAFSILAGGLLSNTPSSDCLVCDVLTVPWTAGTTSKEPWRALTFCLTKDMYTCNTSQAGMVHHPETLQGPVNNEKTPDQNPPLDQEVLEARVHRLWGCKTPVIFWGPSSEVPSSVSCCTTKGTGHLGLCYGKSGVKLMRTYVWVWGVQGVRPLRSLNLQKQRGFCPSIKIWSGASGTPRLPSEWSDGRVSLTHSLLHFCLLFWGFFPEC